MQVGAAEQAVWPGPDDDSVVFNHACSFQIRSAAIAGTQETRRKPYMERLGSVGVRRWATLFQIWRMHSPGQEACHEVEIDIWLILIKNLTVTNKAS